MRRTKQVALSLALSLALVSALSLGLCATAYAQTMDTLDDEPQASQLANSVPLYGGSWNTVYRSDRGINANVRLKSNVHSIWARGVDVRMLDRYGHEIWLERESMGRLDERTYWCGKDVVEIQAKVSTGTPPEHTGLLGECTWEIV